jgi:integrase
MDGLAKVKDDTQLSTQVSDYELVRGFVRKSKAERTLHEYAKQWRAFQTWCECQEPPLECLPASPETLALYISRRAAGTARHVQDDPRWKERPAKPSTIRQALAAIRAAHTAHRVSYATSDELVRTTLEGIERTRLVRPEGKAPVLKKMMHQLLEVLSEDTLAGLRDRALLLVGFTGAFRRSELVAFNVSDFTFGAEGISVLLRKSKTDQRGVGRIVALPEHEDNALLCPVRSTRAWLDKAGITEGRVFRSVDRHGNLGGPLSDRDVARIIKRTARAAKVDKEVVKTLAGHSLRSGLVTSAVKADKSIATIMRQTGHGSIAMVMRYVREASSFTDNAARGLL